MDALFPLLIVTLIAGAAYAGHRVIFRPSLLAQTVPGVRNRTSWTLQNGMCRRSSYTCSAEADFRAGKPRCTCGKYMPPLAPMSKYQVEGGGSGVRLDPSGPLVGSLCEGEWTLGEGKRYEELPNGEWHSPIFDLDYPAVWTPHHRGGQLVARTAVPLPKYLGLLEMMERLRLADPGSAYASSILLEGREGGIVGYRAVGEVMLPEAIFQLIVPARLVPSSTEGHFHLYLDIEMRWSDYLELMRAMAKADLLEADWVKMCESCKMAVLRKPGVRKSPV